MAKGLVLHYLQGGTIDQAVRVGREAGLPEELLESLPGMVFQATSAACAVHMGEKTFAHVIAMLVETGAPQQDAEVLVNLALEHLRQMTVDGGDDRPVPKTTRPWFACEE
jgi:hypothetical protein